MVCWICLVFGIICTCVFIYKREANSSHFALLLKTSSSMLFIMTAIFAVYYNKGDMRYGLLIALGLVFSMLGDIWLDLKWIYPRDIRYYLYGGFVFFLLGHVCYTSALGLSNGIKLTEFLPCLIAPLLVSLGSQLAAKPMKLDFTGYKFIVSLYTFFLVMTLSVSTILAVKTGATSQLMMAVGAFLFFLSDLILSNTYFGVDKVSKPYIASNHALYYAGQFLIAMSVFFFE